MFNKYSMTRNKTEDKFTKDGNDFKNNRLNQNIIVIKNHSILLIQQLIH